VQQQNCKNRIYSKRHYYSRRRYSEIWLMYESLSLCHPIPCSRPFPSPL